MLDGSDFQPVLLDVRWSGPGSADGRAEFEKGHIPGARYVDLGDVLAEPAGDTGGRHPLPHRERFERGMRAAGVRRNHRIVVYDDWNSISAARLWWLLRHHGHDDVLVLDGGWQAWDGNRAPGSGRDVEVGDFVAQVGRLRVLDAEQAAEHSKTGVLLDGRPASRYRGEDEPIDPVAGHIPGARSLPAHDLIGEDGKLLPPEELRAKFHDVGVVEPGSGASYCGSGVQACFLALAAAVAGIDEDFGVYAGSWSDWVSDPARPVA